MQGTPIGQAEHDVVVLKGGTGHEPELDLPPAMLTQDVHRPVIE